jgi:mannose-1-phosphate guanylyltransferase/phosphomannomutase
LGAGAGGAPQRRGASTDLTEGIKVINDDGSWCLVVPDPAEALVRLWAEADNLEESQRLLASWSDVVVRATR